MTDQHHPPAAASDHADHLAHGETLDVNGFDPREFEWRPVPRRPRADGWTPEVQQRFIAALARTGVVERACEEVGLSRRSAYDLRNAPGGEGFARAWAAVLTRAADRLLDIAFEHAIEGEEVPVFDRDGIRIGAKRRYNTRMAMFLLHAYHPERFRPERSPHADRDSRADSRGERPTADRAPPAAEVTVEAAVASLAPVPPVDPHRLATPERLDTMVATARTLADYEANCPPDEREPFRHVVVPDDHPAVVARARRNREKRAAQEQREGRAYDSVLPSCEVPRAPTTPPPSSPSRKPGRRRRQSPSSTASGRSAPS